MVISLLFRSRNRLIEIFVDFNLPKLSGLDLLTKLSQLVDHKAVLISLSGNEATGELREKLDDAIVKPVSKNQILLKLQQYLGEKTTKV